MIEVMTNVLLGPFTRLGRAALNRGALPTEVQARRLAEGGAIENRSPHFSLTGRRII